MLNNTNKCIRYIFIYNIMINFVIIYKKYRDKLFINILHYLS